MNAEVIESEDDCGLGCRGANDRRCARDVDDDELRERGLLSISLLHLPPPPLKCARLYAATGREFVCDQAGGCVLGDELAPTSGGWTV